MPRWLQIVAEVGLAILPFTKAAPITPYVLSGIQLAEQIPGATGDQKKAFALQIVQAGVQATNAVAGHAVLDPTEAQAAAQSTIDTVVLVANLIHSSPAVTAPTTPLAPTA